MTTAGHELQPCDPFCNWILQFVHDGEINPHMILISLTQGRKFAEQEALELTESETNALVSTARF